MYQRNVAVNIFSPHIYSVALPGLIDLKINYSNKLSLKQTKVIKNALRHS